MQHTTSRGPVVAGLAALLALFVLVAPAAGAVGSVSTGSQVADEATNHQFTVDPADGGDLTAVEVGYRSGADVQDATVAVGLDRDGDGAADERLATSRVTTGDDGIRAGLEEATAVSADDAVVVEVRDVRNPSEVGSHTADVAATVDGDAARSTVTYRVTPFRSDDTEFRDVSVPDSTFDMAYATGSTFADVDLVAADWWAVTFEGSVLRDVRGVDDEWTRVEVADTTASGVRTERTVLESVTVSGAALSDVSSTDDAWQDVDVIDSTLHGVDSGGSTYGDVRFRGASVDGFSAEASTLDGVAVRPAADDGARTNLSSASAAGGNGTVAANASVDGPAPSDDEADAAVADVRGDAGQARNRTVANVTLRDAALRNVTVADGALVDVRLESAALRNVTLENVTLRGVTLSGATYADGTLSDEVITSEEELRQELVVREAAGAAGDGDLDAGATATPAEGNATVDDGGAVDGVTGLQG